MGHHNIVVRHEKKRRLKGHDNALDEFSISPSSKDVVNAFHVAGGTKDSSHQGEIIIRNERQ